MQEPYQTRVLPPFGEPLPTVRGGSVWAEAEDLKRDHDLPWWTGRRWVFLHGTCNDDLVGLIVSDEFVAKLVRKVYPKASPRRVEQIVDVLRHLRVDRYLEPGYAEWRTAQYEAELAARAVRR